MTNQTRATVAVPAPSPETSLSLGKEWSGTRWNSAGLCVNTAGRVWLDADGTKSDSTFGALSNGGRAESGQLLVQSLKSNVFLFGEQRSMLCSNGSVFIAGAQGVRLTSGHGAELSYSIPIWGQEIPVLVNTSLENVEPDDTTANSGHADACIHHMDELAEGWSIADISMSAAIIALEACLKVAGCPTSASSVAAAVTVLSDTSRLAGGAMRMARVGGADVPGLHVHAVGEIAANTTGFTSIYAGGGIMMCAGMATNLGFVTAGVTAGLSAALKSGIQSTVEGRTLELIGGISAELATRKGPLKAYGRTLQIGAVGGESRTQVPTVSIDASSVVELTATSSLGSIKQTSAGKAVQSAGTISVGAEVGVTLKSPSYTIAVKTTGIEISIAKTTQLKLTSQSLAATAAGPMKFEVGKDIKLGTSSAGIEVGIDGSWAVKAPMVQM